MSIRNNVRLSGRLGKDPEVKHFDNGNTVAKFTLATTETFVKDNEKQERTEWHKIVMWSGVAKIAEKHLKKGNEITVEGYLKTRSYEGQNGKVEVTEIIVEHLIMHGGSKASTRQEIINSGDDWDGNTNMVL